MASSTFNVKDNETFASQEDHEVTVPNLASRHFSAATAPTPGKLSLEVSP